MTRQCPNHNTALVEQPYGWKCAFCQYVEHKTPGRPVLSTETPTVKIEVTLPVALRDKLDRLTDNRSAWIRAQIEQAKE